MSLSPFVQQLGTIRRTRFDEQMIMLHDLYNSDIPEDMIEQPWLSPAKDHVAKR
jgi:hypothetical protein